ncbi:UDP-N-acetylmuramoyl-tripeptide--D-alanyl-D-alanine ligase [Solemya pervernicosa gill symbiont]|uniref:UDP-N-acetylmuramoyl-tripeptide--D-alanyl-D-alanine ligase n=2 Tax=Gammaproteobacteria incertae sedis TaxID=118884 RepID=A0A1T2L9W3_9GAMM|nr:UDP-N-acetylmuramoyl-tripeptide--D-alanyl-D-alanine ligase [Candidatus Reidiella endopervernicosa]OOZ41881.1 UDP-N-acetylmuramoyl-tripeptide--D-alanyl-D-alanine ligase [Solemya pervernicosa gill symbiont]QKQ26196.1 UDP-N-acetylmuramoyl-tripeptide--D-alanyl-D-alanine ligase [Candidatus Reidiella endopervernicosa]
MSLQQLTALLDGRMIGEDVSIAAVSTDSRTLPQGALFIALSGPNFDGHAFAAQVAQTGAVAVLVSRECETSLPQLVVEDTRVALGQLAGWQREQFEQPLVAVTGSNGKTTVKEMLAAILGVGGEVLATEGNLNNDIGMPLTLLRLEDEQTAAVIEMGANHAGEIAYLTEIARPNVALITNAGNAHLEGFGSLEGVAEAKGEIFSGLSSDGVAVINADDRFAPRWRELAGSHRTLQFGIEHSADVTASHIEMAVAGGAVTTRFELNTPIGSAAINLPLPGRHNVMNALAATAAALAAGANLDQVCRGLAAMTGPKGRLQLRAAHAGAQLIDDSYNANPTSLKAGVEVLSGIGGHRWLVMGDMAELGDDAAALHAEVGVQAKALGIDRLYAVGELSAAAVEAFGAEAFHFESKEALIEALRDQLAADVTLLVKGSRSARMEQVVEGLSIDETSGAGH